VSFPQVVHPGLIGVGLSESDGAITISTLLKGNSYHNKTQLVLPLLVPLSVALLQLGALDAFLLMWMRLGICKSI
jgi:hypothetical protein